jgi:light-regulated signal transduction histidine kinase (bacteriophytochrome)
MWRDQVLAYLLGYALLFAALTWVVRQAVTRRLSRLEDKARLLQAGDYASHGEMDGTDEIASLGASLDQMAKAIARRETELRRFAEVTTHHLQEPARRVACYAERLTAQVAAQLHDPEARLSLEFIRQQAQRQQTLLRDIERYLAADEPRGPLGPTDAAALLRQWQDANAADIAAVGASLQIGELPPAWIDAPRLAELFELALDNALQHGKSRRRTDGAALHIEVTGERLDGTVRYAVSDNGPGIEAAYRERVFTVFERLTTDVEGTGIGLSIVRRIAESIGGRAWIDATPDGGCRLLLELPAGEPR